MENLNEKTSMYVNEKNAQWASLVWESAIAKHPILTTCFHPRYNSNYVEIISHLDVLPMYGSGSKRTEKSKSPLVTFLDTLGEATEIVNAKFTVDKLHSLGFSNPIRTNQEDLECKSQAWLIRSLLNDDKDGYQYIIKQLAVPQINFAASEFILYREGDEQRNRVDVIGLSPDEIFIFEIKRPKNPTGDAVKQIERYVRYYENMEAFYSMLSYYSKLPKEQLERKRVTGCIANGFGVKAEVYRV